MKTNVDKEIIEHLEKHAWDEVDAQTMKQLTVDTTEMEKAGFVILSREEGERRNTAMKQYMKTRKDVWPVEETAFNPRGVTLAEAEAAMKLCMEHQ